MSVKIMGLVWDLDNDIIDREEKYVLLAYTDHADHNGENMYPSIDLICKKTGYKERAAQMITRSLEEKGFLVADGKGPKGTNKWRYGWGAKNAGVQNPEQGGAKSKSEGVQPNAPESLEPPVKPSYIDIEMLKKAGLEWLFLSGKEVTQEMIDAALASQQKNEALTAFERDLQLPANWQWFPAKATDEKAMSALRRFVVSEYEKDNKAFEKYQTWRNQPYVKGAMSNLSIKRNPENFQASWSDYLASSAMYGKKTDETRPQYAGMIRTIGQ